MLVATTVAQFGLTGLLTAVLISGALLTLMGLARLGSLVKHIPHAVTVGFTCAIAVTILASQLRDVGGLTLSGPEPGPFIPKLAALVGAIRTLNPFALGLTAIVAALIAILRRWRPTWPGMLVGVVLAAIVAAVFHLPVTTIAARFGHIATGLPAPSLPRLAPATVLAVLPSAISFTMLGAVESLLSAKVADGMTGRKHRSNMELVAQGLANIASACFGGICVTGTIARTATNIRAGAQSPVAGLLHSALLLIFMLIAAPLIGFIPLSALAGVLVVVAWNMAEKVEFLRLLCDWRTATVMLATLGLTVVRDLTTGMIAGCVLAAIYAALHRAVPEEGD